MIKEKPEEFFNVAKKSEHLLRARNASGASLLHIAAARPLGQASKIICGKLLEDYEASPSTTDYQGETALFAAVGAVGGKNTLSLPKSQAEIQLNKVELLLENRSDIEARDSSGKSVLFNAVHSPACLSILKLLISRGAPLQALDNNGHNCLKGVKDASVRKALEDAGLQTNDSKERSVSAPLESPFVVTKL